MEIVEKTQPPVLRRKYPEQSTSPTNEERKVHALERIADALEVLVYYKPSRAEMKALLDNLPF